MDDLTKRFIQSYESLRKSNKVVNGKDFAKKLNVSQSLISDINTNRVKPGVSVIQKLSKQFNINSHWLLTGEGEMFNNTNITNDIKNTYSDNQFSLKDIIHFYCKKKGITIKELANKIEMSEANIHLRFKKNSMELDHLKKIAAIFDIPIETLVRGEINLVNESQIIYQTSHNNSENTINMMDDKKIQMMKMENDNLKNQIESQKEKIAAMQENIASLKKIISLLEKE